MDNNSFKKEEIFSIVNYEDKIFETIRDVKIGRMLLDVSEYFFYNVFKKIPQKFFLWCDKGDTVIQDSECSHAENRYYLNIKDTYMKILSDKQAKYQTNILTFPLNGGMIILFATKDTKIAFMLGEAGRISSTDVTGFSLYTDNITEAEKILKEWVVFRQFKEDELSHFGVLCSCNDSLYVKDFNFRKMDVDIEKNYNSDIPYDKICSCIENDKSSFILFHGKPGTGKTTLIKHLINKYNDKYFIMVDGEILRRTSVTKIMECILSHENCIFILEDCEKILVDRTSENNSIMPTLLNLTDGIIGESLGLKMICTFNTKADRIDKALLRKGRLSLKYEFKDLSADKVRMITGDDSITTPMPLCDVYNIGDKVDYSDNNNVKIGFNKG